MLTNYEDKRQCYLLLKYTSKFTEVWGRKRGDIYYKSISLGLYNFNKFLEIIRLRPT